MSSLELNTRLDLTALAQEAAVSVTPIPILIQAASIAQARAAEEQTMTWHSVSTHQPL
jgi:hypothetical protein